MKNQSLQVALYPFQPYLFEEPQSLKSWKHKPGMVARGSNPSTLEAEVGKRT